MDDKPYQPPVPSPDDNVPDNPPETPPDVRPEVPKETLDDSQRLSANAPPEPRVGPETTPGPGPTFSPPPGAPGAPGAPGTRGFAPGPPPPPYGAPQYGDPRYGAPPQGFPPPYGAPPSGPRGPYSAPPPPPAPPRQGFSWGAFFGGTLLGCGCLSWLVPVLALTFLAAMLPKGEAGPKGNSVGLINVDGIITSGAPNGGLFGGTGAEAQRIVEQLQTARKNKSIRAVVLYINSPGGSAAGSDAVYNEIMKLKASGKPVVSAMGDVAASGGYYIAAATDRIYANGATLTGSIGVITELPNVSDPNGWIEKTGYDVEVIKSGKFKDLGNPFRALRPEERALLQQMVNDIYNQFLTAVSKGRGMSMAQLRPLADGRVFTGRQAVNNKLVDEIGTLQDAINYAGSKAGLKADPNVYKFKDNPFSQLFGGPGALSPGFSGLSGRGPLGLLLLDPRAQALAKSLAGQPAGMGAR